MDIIKKFIITVDTEGDNAWKLNYNGDSTENVTVKNGDYIIPFQELCEKYNFIPTYLTDFEMCQSGSFVEMAKDKLKLQKLEIGMHMHAWSTPPFYDLPVNTNGNKPYVGEYPVKIIEQKVDYLTKTIEDTFGVKAVSHRGGRWYVDSRYLRILKKHGYIVDCTVCPRVDWRTNRGLFEDTKGIDYRKFPSEEYEMDLKSLDRPGKSGFYQVPVTIDYKQSSRLIPISKKNKIWLRPNGNNLNEMLFLVDRKAKSSNYIEFMLHSSELMPGGSKIFRTNVSIRKLYHDLNILFEAVSKNFEGVSLENYVKQRFALVK